MSEQEKFIDKDEPTCGCGECNCESRAEEVCETTVVTEEQELKIAELQERLLRLQADFDNFRRRSRQEKDDLRNWVRAEFATDLLPVMDNFERALSTDKSDNEQLQAGVNMIYRQLINALEKNDLSVIESENCVFDPKCHEAVAREETDEYPDGTILLTMQKGYRLGERVLRPAMVKVACQ